MSVLQVVLHLQLANDPSDVRPVRAAIRQHPHGPVRATFIARVHPDHAASMYVRDLATQVWIRLDSLYQHLLQLRGGAGGLGHLRYFFPGKVSV